MKKNGGFPFTFNLHLHHKSSLKRSDPSRRSSQRHPQRDPPEAIGRCETCEKNILAPLKTNMDSKTDGFPLGISFSRVLFLGANVSFGGCNMWVGYAMFANGFSWDMVFEEGDWSEVHTFTTRKVIGVEFFWRCGPWKLQHRNTVTWDYLTFTITEGMVFMCLIFFHEESILATMDADFLGIMMVCSETKNVFLGLWRLANSPVILW